MSSDEFSRRLADIAFALRYSEAWDDTTAPSIEVSQDEIIVRYPDGHTITLTAR